MSFAATMALIAVFEALRRRPWWLVTQTSPGWRFARPVLGIAVTSLIAGLATAPFSAFHFNAVEQYGLLANLLAIPAMGLVVMPACVIAVLAAPFGLDWLPFQVAGLGMGYIIAVADFVAGLGGAQAGVPAGPPASLALIALGGLFLVLWIGRGRSAGLAAMALGAALWAAADRPDILIAESGRLFGIRSDAGRLLSSARGNGYAAASWLENDGDLASQEEAWARGRLARRNHRIEAEVPGLGRVLYVGASDAATAAEDCTSAAILIAPNWRRPSSPATACSSAARGSAATGRWRSASRRGGSRSRRRRPAGRGPGAATRRRRACGWPASAGLGEP